MPLHFPRKPALPDPSRPPTNPLSGLPAPSHPSNFYIYAYSDGGKKCLPPLLPLTISVSQDDIDNGKVKDCWDCPISQAAFRAVDFKLPVYCTETVIRIGNTDFHLPIAAQFLIARIDNIAAGEPLPLVFTLTEQDRVFTLEGKVQ